MIKICCLKILAQFLKKKMKTRSYITQMGFEFPIYLFLPPECWDYKCVQALLPISKQIFKNDFSQEKFQHKRLNHFYDSQFLL